MPSNAFSQHLNQLLSDTTELDAIHTQLRTGLPGRQFRLASLYRAAVVISVSAWESYVEELMRESLFLNRTYRPQSTSIRERSGTSAGDCLKVRCPAQWTQNEHLVIGN